MPLVCYRNQNKASFEYFDAFVGYRFMVFQGMSLSFINLPFTLKRMHAAHAKPSQSASHPALFSSSRGLSMK